MARTRDPFGTVMRTLCERLAQGAYPPGAALIIIDLAAEFAFSTTPVREALAFLAGAGAIEERRGGGYRCWSLTPGDLEALYDLHRAYLEIAMRQIRPHLAASAFVAMRDLAGPRGAEPVSVAASRIFEGLIAASRSAPLAHAYAGLSLRLGVARRAEAWVFDDLDAELDALVAGAGRDLAALTQAIDAYHQRRRHHSLDIHAYIQMNDEHIINIY